MVNSKITKTPQDHIKNHYDHVSNAWQLIMGDNLHYGFFKKPSDDLDTASEQLLTEMLKLIPPPQAMRILDVGCGVGEPAFYLYKHFQSLVTGIALGENEIAEANRKKMTLGLDQELHFLIADGEDNNLPTSSFDLVIMMESSLLMPNKLKLFQENFRVLKPGGKLLICDQMKGEALAPSEMYKLGKHLEALQNTFGPTLTESLSSYQTIISQAGFEKIVAIDISKDVSNTPEYWKQSCINNEQSILKHVSSQTLNQFKLACDGLSILLGKGALTYGIVKADKPF